MSGGTARTGVARSAMNSTEADSTPKRVFVVGCPRSGTTWTMWLLAQHPSVVACNHAGLFHALAPLEKWWRTRREYAGQIHVAADDRPMDEMGESRAFTRIDLTEVLPPEDFYDKCRPLAEEVFARIAAARPGATVVVEQTPENIDFAETILRIFPGAYFLHVVRDPRGTLASMRMTAASWAGAEFPTNPVGAAQMWQSYVSRGRNIANATSRYHEVHYEALLTDGVAELQRIYEWLGIAAGRSLCERAMGSSSLERLREKDLAPKGFFRKGLLDGWRDELSSSQVRTVEYVTGDLMESLGYERRFERRAAKPARVRFYEILATLAVSLKGSRLAGPLRRVAVSVRRLEGRRNWS